MSKLEKELNKRYGDLCQRLGDAILKREQLDELIKELKSQIDSLNKNYPLIQSLVIKAMESDNEEDNANTPS